MSFFNSNYYRPSSASFGERSGPNRYYHNRRLARVAPRAQSASLTDPRWVSFKEVQAAVAAWIEAKADSFDFAASMYSAVIRYGDLTPNQYTAIENCMARDAERAQQGQNPARQTTSVEFPNIRAAFDAVVAGGAVKAQMTVDEVNLSLAPLTGRNPGALYVKVNGQYAGKIVGKVFQPGRDAPADLVGKLVEIERDPRAAIQSDAARRAARLALAIAEGRSLTIPCGCCGLTLSDEVSIARGIGPICAGKWGV